MAYVDERDCEKRVCRLFDKLDSVEKNVLTELTTLKVDIQAHQALHLGQSQAEQRTITKSTLILRVLTFVILGVSSIAGVVLFIFRK